MTNERAIEILDPEHREQYDSIEIVNEACRIGMNAIKRVQELEAENAELRERLSRAVELPRVEASPYDENDSLLYYIENDHIQCECFNNKFPEQLKNKLKELSETQE